jgi:hypothetical protein
MKSKNELRKEFSEIKHFKFKSVLISIAIVIGLMFLLTSCEDKCIQVVEKIYKKTNTFQDPSLYSSASTSIMDLDGDHYTRETASIWDYLAENKRHIIASGCLDAADERYTCFWAKIEGDLYLEDDTEYSTVNVNLVVTGSIAGGGTFTVDGHDTKLIVEGDVSAESTIIVKDGCELIIEGSSLGTNTPTMRDILEVPCSLDLTKTYIDDKGEFYYREKY